MLYITMTFKKGFKLSEESERKRRESLKAWWAKNRESSVAQKRLNCLKTFCKGSDNPMYGKKGKDAGHWKGGKTTHRGYVYVKTDTKLPKWNGYVKRANLVWFENTGEVIKKPFLLHHINGEKLDDGFENLVKVKLSSHTKEHNKHQKRGTDGRFCGSGN